jgi:hypothetical protein
MMPAALVLIAVLIVSAVTKLHAVIFGQPVVIPALWLVLAIVTLLVFAFALVLLRLLIQDGLHLRPVVVRT